MKIEINVSDLVNYLPTVLHALQTNQVGAAYLVALASLLCLRRPEIEPLVGIAPTEN